MRSASALAVAAALCWAGPASAAAVAPPPPPSPAPAPSVPADDTAISHGSVTIGGRVVVYTARAGTLPLRDAAGNETARVFSVAYLADGADPRTRPVTFVWNGGPGSSSMWLHLGSFGPLRLAVPSDATQPAPHTPLAPNPDSLLDTTDLVFIDAVGTGYSRLAAKGTAAMFYGIDQDAAAFAAFIRSWATQNDRWNSPVFLLGESYGTVRASIVVNLLQRSGMAVDGVALLSSALDYNVLDGSQGPGEDYQYIAFLPSEAAVAWYHHAGTIGGPDVAQVVAAARTFAAGPYADALMRGDDLDVATRRTIVARLHAFTGLDPAYIDRANLRISPSRFEYALQHPQAVLTGRLDGRYGGPMLDRTGDSAGYDPTTDDALTDAFVSAFNGYVQSGLRYRTDQPYLGTNYPVVNNDWVYRRKDALSAPNVLGDLRLALVRNPYLRVFSANGYYDLGTPFFATEYSLAHLGLDAAVRARVSFGFYAAGHMIYINDQARTELRSDLVRFYRDAEARR